MAGTIKAGIPHVIKVNTKADKMGQEAGFDLKYYNDATREMVSVAGAFFEFENTIVPASTTVVGNHAAGIKELTLDSATSFPRGSVLKIGDNYSRVVSVAGNVVTLKHGLAVAVVGGATVDLSGRTGTYGLPVTFPAKGKYTVHMSNPSIGMDNEAAPVSVENADIDDVKLLIDTLQADMSAVKSQVDALDEDEVNNISEKVTELTTTLNTVHKLILNTDGSGSAVPSIVVAGELLSPTLNIVAGDTLTGNTSGATGIVANIAFDGTNTTIELSNVSGVFQTGETLTLTSTIPVGWEVADQISSNGLTSVDNGNGTYTVTVDTTGFTPVNSVAMISDVSGDYTPSISDVVIDNANHTVTFITINNLSSMPDDIYASGAYTDYNGVQIENVTVNSTGNNAIDSVIEFVEEINRLLNAENGLAVLKGLNKDIENLINGSATLEDGSVNPTAGKGLVKIFDEIVASHSEITEIKTLVNDTTVGLAAIKTAVDAGKTAIEAKLDAMLNGADENSLTAKINAVKLAVEANRSILENSTFGLEAVKTNLDTLAALFVDGGSVEVRFDVINEALATLSSAILTAIEQQTAHLDSKFAELEAKLTANAEATTYSVFA